MSVALFVVAGDRGHFAFSIPLAERLITAGIVDKVEYSTSSNSEDWVRAAFPQRIKDGTVTIGTGLGEFPRGMVDFYTEVSSYGDSEEEGFHNRVAVFEKYADTSKAVDKDKEDPWENALGTSQEIQAMLQKRMQAEEVKFVVCEASWTRFAIRLSEAVETPWFNFSPTWIQIFRHTNPALADIDSVKNDKLPAPGTFFILTEALRGKAMHTLTGYDKNYRAIGPILPPVVDMKVSDDIEKWLSKSPGTPVIYFSLGSHFMSRVLPPESVTNILKGIREAGCRCIAVLPKNTDANIKKHSEDKDVWFKACSWVNQKALLRHPNVTAFFTHCGSNSVAECLSAGKPMLCLPFFDDQYYLADEIVRNEAGIRIHKPVNDTNVILKAASEITGESFVLAAQRLQKVIADEDGLKAAVDVIQDELRAKTS